MKSSFTMIELIFVIVILGILASVAIPKMVATRTDAEITKIGTQFKEGLKEYLTYKIAHGGDVNFSEISEGDGSQVALNELIHYGWLEVKDDNHSVLYDSHKDGKEVCVSFKTDGHQIEQEFNTSNNSNFCKAMKKMAQDRNYTVTGSTLTF